MAPYGGWVGQTQHKVHHFFSQIFAGNRELQNLEKSPSITMLNQGHRIPHLIYNTYPPAKTPSNLQLLKIKTYVWILYDGSPLWWYLMQVNLKTLAPKEEAKAVPLARMCIDKCTRPSIIGLFQNQMDTEGLSIRSCFVTHICTHSLDLPSRLWQSTFLTKTNRGTTTHSHTITQIESIANTIEYITFDSRSATFIL